MPQPSNTLPAAYPLEEYRLVSVLGSGGFGVTYKATDTLLETWVAIKEYFPSDMAFRGPDGVSVHPNRLGQKPMKDDNSRYLWGLRRFLDEARVLARIQHPHVVRVKRFFRANGTAYIVMEYEQGEPLNKRLKRTGPLPEADLQRLLDEVLAALAAVHQEGYLHRDLKPANIYLRERDGGAVLLDFGAAREAVGHYSMNLTAVVTPGYSPPEQYAQASHRSGPWTDIYSLGACLYHVITGSKPPAAPDRIMEDALIPATVAAAGHYAPALLKAIDHALVVRPGERPQSVAELRALLKHHEVNDDVSVTAHSEAATAITGPTNWFDPAVTSVVATALSTPPPPVARSSPAVQRRGRWWGMTALVVGMGLSAYGIYQYLEMPAPGTVWQELQTGMEFIRLPEGCFTMGSPASEVGRNADETAQETCVKGFWIGRYEVTNAQYRRYMPQHDSGTFAQWSLNNEQQPAIGITWEQATAYADWLSVSTGQRYRLPTEAEWEYAARAGTTTARYWGDAADRACTYANVYDQYLAAITPLFGESHACDDSQPVTAVVGTYQPNAFGLYDMLGNAAEWTCSAYAASYQGAERLCADQGQRILRGGSWSDIPGWVRSAFRYVKQSSIHIDEAHETGFRLVRE